MCIYSEWNYFAQKTYEANFGEVPFGDITKINENEIRIMIFNCRISLSAIFIAGVSKKMRLAEAMDLKI